MSQCWTLEENTAFTTFSFQEIYTIGYETIWPSSEVLILIVTYSPAWQNTNPANAFKAGENPTYSENSYYQIIVRHGIKISIAGKKERTSVYHEDD